MTLIVQGVPSRCNRLHTISGATHETRTYGGLLISRIEGGVFFWNFRKILPIWFWSGHWVLCAKKLEKLWVSETLLQIIEQILKIKNFTFAMNKILMY